MHDELRRFGLRRMRIWTAVLVAVGTLTGVTLACLAMLDPDWPPDEAGVAGGWTTVLVGAAVGLVGTVLLVLFGHYSGARRAWPTVPLIPAPDLVPLAEGLALARGEPIPRVWRLDSAAPERGLPTPPARAAPDRLHRDRGRAHPATSWRR